MNKRLIWLILVLILAAFLFPKVYDISGGFSGRRQDTKWCLWITYEYYPQGYHDANTTYYCIGIPRPK